MTVKRRSIGPGRFVAVLLGVGLVVLAGCGSSSKVVVVGDDGGGWVSAATIGCVGRWGFVVGGGALVCDRVGD